MEQLRKILAGLVKENSQQTYTNRYILEYSKICRRQSFQPVKNILRAVWEGKNIKLIEVFFKKSLVLSIQKMDALDKSETYFKI